MTQALHSPKVKRPRFGSPRLPLTFWARCVKDARTGCWYWTGSIGDEGYPDSITIATIRQAPFRHAYRALIGPIRPKMTLDHLCRVRHCVNPGHADQCTAGENARRAKMLVYHCPRGHLYDDANTLWVGPGKRARACRACYNDRSRAYWHTTRKHREKAARRAAGYRGGFDEQSHCPSGDHPRTEANTYTAPSGARSCRPCRNTRSATYNAAARTPTGSASSGGSLGRPVP